tara:strand:- start:261 stop:737 length:477 start_codon:yes stop_codon:yes gene_type:complete
MSSPTDWYDTNDPNEYIGPAPLTNNMANKPKTGAINMQTVNEQQAKATFEKATGFNTDNDSVVSWTQQLLTDFTLGADEDLYEAIADYAEQEADRNTHYMNAILAAESGIWATDNLDKYEFGRHGTLQMDEVLAANAYETIVDLLTAYALHIYKEVVA